MTHDVLDHNNRIIDYEADCNLGRKKHQNSMSNSTISSGSALAACTHSRIGGISIIAVQYAAQSLSSFTS
jgi:hypothetical protein